MNNTNSSKFELWNTRLSVIIPTLTVLTFIIGTLWANLFFQQFHIDFFKVSGFSGAFHFLFSNIKVVALSLTIAIAYYVLFALLIIYLVMQVIDLIINKFLSDAEIDDKKEEKLSKPIIWLFGILIVGTMIYGTSDFINYITVKVADTVKFNVKARMYEPVTIQYSDPQKMELKCVYQLGGIGNYNAYLSKSRDVESKEIQLITHLIKEDAITAIRYPFSYLTKTTKKERAEVIKKNWDKLCS